jgi:hypothetical protein
VAQIVSAVVMAQAWDDNHGLPSRSAASPQAKTTEWFNRPPGPTPRPADPRFALEKRAGLARNGSGWRPSLPRPARAADAHVSRLNVIVTNRFEPNCMNTEDNRDFQWWPEEEELHLFTSYLKELDGFLSEGIRRQESAIERSKEVSWYYDEAGIARAKIGAFGYQPQASHLLRAYESFKNLLLKSFIVSLYTTVETHLAQKCRRVQQEFGYALSWKDLAGNGIAQSTSYLTKVHGIAFSTETSPEWKQIQDIRRLRNCIVHNGGYLDENVEQYRQLQDYLRNEPTIEIDTVDNNIVLNKAYCDKAMAIVAGFFAAINSAIMNKQNQAGG